MSFYSTLAASLASILIVALGRGASARAEQGEPEVFRSDPKAKKVERTTRRQTSQEEKAPPAPLVEVSGRFTKCTAARMLELELARRVSKVDPGRARGDRWTQYSYSQALLRRWQEHVDLDGDCHEEDHVLAERIMQQFQVVVDHPDLRRDAIANAPVTVSTAAQAGRLLDGIAPPILKGWQPRPIRWPCKTDDAQCKEELQRRENLLAEVLEGLRALMSR